jgi:prepilin-type N-terminal cleavage/methylation domain-containing protein
MKRKAGFTLVEIMIVVLIIGLLATIAVPTFIRARERTRRSICVNNLRQIDGAKEQLAMETNLANGANLSANTVLDVYIKGGYASLDCPSNGAYTPGSIGTNPTCNYNNATTLHTLTP